MKLAVLVVAALAFAPSAAADDHYPTLITGAAKVDSYCYPGPAMMDFAFDVVREGEAWTLTLVVLNPAVQSLGCNGSGLAAAPATMDDLGSWLCFTADGINVHLGSYTFCIDLVPESDTGLHRVFLLETYSGGDGYAAAVIV